MTHEEHFRRMERIYLTTPAGCHKSAALPRPSLDFWRCDVQIVETLSIRNNALRKGRRKIGGPRW
eukprot:scaffold554232_cov36-Prasinocladus_malaysianus.AAC.1